VLARLASLKGYELIACLIISAAAAVIMLPIFVRGLPNGYDAYVHYRWSTQFNESLREPGVLYPRWLGGGNSGLGSPVMLYYPPLPFYVEAGFNYLSRDTLTAMALNCWAALALSGLAMYVLCRSIASSQISLLGAVIYMAAPYHLFDLYQRAAISEFWTFVWLPLVLDAMYRLSRGKRFAVVYLSVSYALLLLTHIPVSFAFTLVLPLYFPLLTRDGWKAVQAGAGLLLGAGLSAIFLVPVLLERGYVRIERLLGISYLKYFLFESSSDLFTGPLFQFDAIGRANVLKMSELSAISLLVFLAVVISITVANRRRAPNPRRSLLRAAWLITVVALLMTTVLSSAIWRFASPLHYLQFPYRWLAIATTGTIPLIAAAVTTLGASNRRRLPYIIGLSMALVFSILVSTLFATRASYDREAIEARLFSKETREYRPIWWDKQKRSDEDEPDELEGTPARITTGDAGLQAIDETGIRQSYTVDARTESTVEFRTLYFPGWNARIDGRQAQIGPNKNGHLEVTCEPGAHTLTLSFEDTWPRTLGKTVSGLSLLILGVLCIARRRDHPRSLEPPAEPGD